jgi:hypothetical protein
LKTTFIFIVKEAFMTFSKLFCSISIALLLAVVSFAHASLPKTTVRGRIVDQNRAIVVGASVTAKNPTGESSISVATNNAGEFSLSLEPGDYVLEVKADGFSPLSRRLRVSPDDKAEIELRLEIASATAIVTVSDSDTLQRATYSATKTPTALRDLPQTIAIVNKQQITDQSFSSISDVVRYQAGISSPQGENNRDQLIIRGQNSSADFFLNGVRDDVQYYRDLYNLENVEILRGPQCPCLWTRRWWRRGQSGYERSAANAIL